MILLNLKSGLGNQLFQYAVGRQLSILKKTPLKLDVSFFKHEGNTYAYDQLTRSFKLNCYNINAEIASVQEIEKLTKFFKSTSFYARLYKKAIKVLPRYKWQYFKEREWWVYESELFKLKAEVYIEGYWQHYKYFQNLPHEILKELTLKEAYENIYKDEIEADNASVSIHIRRGDYVGDGLFAVQPLEYYKSAISLINKRVKNPTFYIFSDDLNWVKDNVNFNAPTTFVEGLSDIIDLDLMSKCRHNIIANSSFSWWGAMLNKNVSKTVIAPSKWVLPENLNNRIELAFPSWILV